MKSQIISITIASLMLAMTACKNEGFFSEPAEGALNGLINQNKEPEFSFDWINKQQIVPGENAVSGDGIEIVGWAMNPDSKEAPGKVFVAVNGTLFTAETGIARDDVANYFKNTAYQKSGFRAKFARSLFKPGAYSIELRVVSKDGKSYYSSAPDKAIVIKI